MDEQHGARRPTRRRRRLALDRRAVHRNRTRDREGGSGTPSPHLPSLTDGASPRAFEIYIGGFGAPSYGVWWDGEQLVYESFLRDYAERRQVFLTPSTAQWRRFWRTMDQIDVWSWLGRYKPGERFEPLELVRDGTHWSLTLAHDDLSIESCGDSGGPDSVDLEESERFVVFLGAVSRLIGGRTFS